MHRFKALRPGNSFAGFNRVFKYALGGVGAVALLLYLASADAKRTRTSWPHAPAEVLDERCVLTNVYEGHTGGGLIYQGEVQASYYAEGRHFKLWIPALHASEDQGRLKDQLQVLASRKCSVRWEPGRPQQPVLEC